MPSAEEERAVFEDDDDEETEGDDTEEEDDDADADADAEPLAVAPPATAAAPTAERLSGSAIPSSSDRPPNPNPNPNPTSSAAANPNSSSSDPSSSDLTPSSAHPQNGAIPAAASAPVAVSVSGGATPTAAADPGRALVVSSASEERRPPGSAFDESRRLFQRLWTDEDEIIILRGFLDFTSRRGTTFASHQYDTGPFYEEMKKQLQFEFTKNQLIEKLRRLKKKYRNCVNRISTMGKDFAFKSAHEQAIFEIARNIWRPGIKRSRDSDDDENEDLNPPTNDADPNHAIVVADGPLSSDRRVLRTRRRLRRRTTEESAAVAADTGAGTAVPVMVTVENSIPPPQTPSVQPATVPGIIEETVKSCLSPLFKELINSAIGGGPQLSSGLLGGGGLLGLLGVSPPSLNIGGNLGSNSSGTPPVDEKWRKQQVLELEVYLKRIELVQEQIKLTLEELKKPGVS
ncbi:probable transcription factor At5g28040 [Ananas comosus]|uniref:Probable transcription factor At5g28040 n=1 Tax=Ananas comosus TaxID=4615 RepID=A0A6P5GC06_ANACO|nr:probable transcription factor At5g28040 [Ananas comosus]